MTSDKEVVSYLVWTLLPGQFKFYEDKIKGYMI
jgi:hypothetical protein